MSLRIIWEGKISHEKDLILVYQIYKSKLFYTKFLQISFEPKMQLKVKHEQDENNSFPEGGILLLENLQEPPMSQMFSPNSRVEIIETQIHTTYTLTYMYTYTYTHIHMCVEICKLPLMV